MLKQSIDHAFFRSFIQVDTDENQGIKVSYNLRTEDAKQDSARFNRFLGKENTKGIFGDDSFKQNINKIFYLDICLSSEKPMVFPKTIIDLRVPLDNMPSLWLPGMIFPCKNFRAKGMLEFYEPIVTHLCNLAPIGAFFSAESANKLSFAFSDCLNIVKMTPGAYEEEECARVAFEIFSEPTPERTEYKATLRLDSSFVPLFTALDDIATWYENQHAIDVMPVPQGAIEPVYSTWYSFLQNIHDYSIEEQCAIASKLGCKTVIVDDGWQTDDNNRGYAFCGDWQISKKRFPDMKAHVKRVHDMGMKYMIWFSVPFIGGKSQNHEEFKDYCLNFNPRWGAYTLDPRYKLVRDFLVKTFSDMVREYDLDGLKLDFIDEFDMRKADEKALAYDAKRDTQDLPQAVDMLMTEIRTALTAIKSDVLIEFRQNYIGPMIRKYGNMFRAHDCPNDTLMNRMTTLDLRAICKNTAVHADMFTWSPSESVESASLNFIHTLFAVPQVSANFTHLNDEHKNMVAHWLNFWTERKDLLLNGTLDVANPEFQYSLVRTTKAHQQLIQVNANLPLELFEQDSIKEVTLVNGAMSESFILKSYHDKSLQVKAKIFDCLGTLVSDSTLTLEHKVQELSVPKSGYVVLTI